MERSFCMLGHFDQCWKSMGLNDDDLTYLQCLLTNNPETGNVIQGTSGARKVRIAMQGQGKSGGGRVIYVDLVVSKKIYLISAYPKNEKENLSQKDVAMIKKIVEAIKNDEKE